MKRRALLAASELPLLAQAQQSPAVRRIEPPLPAGADGKVEVVEFFWYGCPACNAFEPALQAWVQKLPPWVSFRHQHVLLREMTRPHQRLWFTLNAMGVEHRFRTAIFAAMHAQGNRLETPQAMIQLLQPLGLDVARFQSTWASFEPKAFSAARIDAVNRQVAERYRLGGVPSLAIGGRWMLDVMGAAERRPESPTGATALRLADQLLSSLKPA
jgi:thiol:disulfide interchange protein DsbA